MKRPDPKSTTGTGQPSGADDAFVKAYPSVWSYLADETWDDGKDRQPSALSLTWKEGCWQLALNDKALKQSLYTCAPTQKEALGLMEKALRDGTGVWRSWKRGK